MIRCCARALVVALCLASSIHAQTFTGFVGNSWEAPLNWSPNLVPGTGDFAEILGFDVVISQGAVDVAALSVSSGAFLNSQQNLSVTNTLAVQASSGLALAAGRTLRADRFYVAGSSSLGFGYDTDIVFLHDFTVLGNSTINFSDVATLVHQDGFDGAVALNDSTLTGSGTIFSDVTLNQNSMVNANGPTPFVLGEASDRVVNNGLLKSSNGGSLYLYAGVFENTHGNIVGEAFSQVIAAGEIRGGTLEGKFVNDNQGNLVSKSDFRLAGVLDGTVNPVSLKGMLSANGGLLKGTIQNHATVAGADLGFAGTTRLEGGGRIAITGLLHGVAGNGTAVVTQSQHSIEGYGSVGTGNTGFVRINNEQGGVIEANVSGQTLTVLTTIDSGFDRMHNQGFLRASNGGTLRLSGAGNNTTAIPTIDNVGGTLYADQFSKVIVDMKLEGGTLNSFVPPAANFNTHGVIEVRNLLDGSASPITNLGYIDTAAEAHLVGTLQNAGTVYGSWVLDGNTTLSGGGHVTNAPNRFLFISAASNVATPFDLVNDGNIISGRGSISSRRIRLVNQSNGEITADLAGDSLDFNVSNTQISLNHGVLGSTNGGRLNVFAFGSSVLNDGIIQASSGGTTTVHPLANLVAGTLTGGQYQVHGAGSTLAISGDVVRLDARLVLDGPGTIVNNWLTSSNALLGFQSVNSNGELLLQNGRGLNTGPLSNSGIVRIEDQSTLVVANSFVQLGGRLDVVDVDSRVTVGGTLTVSGGTVTGKGKITANQISLFGVDVAPGNSPGELSLLGNTTMAPATTLHIELGGTNPGLDYDLLSVSGILDLGGATLSIELVDSFISRIQGADTFHFVTATGGRQGEFAGLHDSQRVMTFDGSGSFLIHYGANEVFLSNFVPTIVPEPSAATLALIGIGLGLVASVRRRR